ncbi:hypothetical protein, partial [Streptomyces sp. NPDC015414]|uniref:hypothetical protein n=1 Tax=Streptomyces sp. NPDC015414 TaxID=3364957 RepID=UPI0036FA4974
ERPSSAETVLSAEPPGPADASPLAGAIPPAGASESAEALPLREASFGGVSSFDGSAAEPSGPPTSTYGRMRSGSKSSAAAASAVRVSRSASDARSVQSHDGV